jgi:hypothetical protein
LSLVSVILQHDLFFLHMTRLSQLCKQQRERKDSIRETRHRLAAVLQIIRHNSSRAMTLLGQLQNEHEICLAQGNVICSKIQHAVIESDPDSASVAACVTAIDNAISDIAKSSSVSVRFLNHMQTLGNVSIELTQSHKNTNVALVGMSDTHQHAFDIHSFAVDAIENGFGATNTTDITCADCGEFSELVYAARTGMCQTCAKKYQDESGWTRCIESV